MSKPDFQTGKLSHDVALARHLAFAQARADVLARVSVTRTKTARDALHHVANGLQRDIDAAWTQVTAARAAWHAAQSQSPEGRSLCTCGCEGRALPGEPRYDNSEWLGAWAHKARGTPL